MTLYSFREFYARGVISARWGEACAVDSRILTVFYTFINVFDDCGRYSDVLVPDGFIPHDDNKSSAEESLVVGTGYAYLGIHWIN